MTKPCGRPVPNRGACTYNRMKGKQQCEWHWLTKQPPHIQEAAAERRYVANIVGPDQEIARVPASEWPPGERWCAGCQSFVPLFYCRGSRCRACVAKASHEARVQATYGLAPGEYDELFRRQAGCCFICQRSSKGKRLAVDHDHKTGKVRGLLCANNEHGCNAGVVGNLEAARDGGLAAAKRAVLYLALPPYERLQLGHGLSWAEFIAQEAARLAGEADQPPPRVFDQPPPF